MARAVETRGMTERGRHSRRRDQRRLQFDVSDYQEIEGGDEIQAGTYPTSELSQISG